jgi:hypothetical protein
MEKLAFQTALTYEVENSKAAVALAEEGVTLHDWSAEDRAAFRAAARGAWEGWAERTPEAREIVDSNYGFMEVLGLAEAKTD